MPLTEKDVPWPGKTFVISKLNSTDVVTTVDRKVILQDYRSGSVNQKWNCELVNGFLQFWTYQSDGDDEKLWWRVDAPWIFAYDDGGGGGFVARKDPSGGYEILGYMWYSPTMAPLYLQGDELNIGNEATSSLRFGFTVVES
jgi:hypothetical protein